MLDGDIQITTRSGTGRLNLTNSPELDACPVWSTSGTWIAFESEQEDMREIHVAGARVGRTWSVTPGRSGDLCAFSTPARRLWSLDDAALLFVRSWDRDGDVYAVARDGSWEYNITRDHREIFHGSPAWVP